MSSKAAGIKVMIQSVDCMIALNISSETTGERLLDMILNQLRICEKHWFGLFYHDVKENARWLDLSKKINIKDVKPFGESGAHFKFTIHFYPESHRVEFCQSAVQVFFFKSEFMRLLTNKQVDILPEHRVLNAIAYVKKIIIFDMFSCA